MFRTARNLIIDRFRHEQVVSIEAVPDLEAFELAADTPGPDRTALARSELPGKQRQSQNVSLWLYCLMSTLVTGRANIHTTGMLPVEGEYGVFILPAVAYSRNTRWLARQQ